MAAPKSLVINIQQDLDSGAPAQAFAEGVNPILAKIVETAQLQGADMLVGGHTKFGLDFSKSSAA